jgi:hypothetical protein
MTIIQQQYYPMQISNAKKKVYDLYPQTIIGMIYNLNLFLIASKLTVIHILSYSDFGHLLIHSMMRRLFAATKVLYLYLSLLGSLPFPVSIHPVYHPMLPLPNGKHHN